MRGASLPHLFKFPRGFPEDLCRRKASASPSQGGRILRFGRPLMSRKDRANTEGRKQIRDFHDLNIADNASSLYPPSHGGKLVEGARKEQDGPPTPLALLPGRPSCGSSGRGRKQAEISSGQKRKMRGDGGDGQTDRQRDRQTGEKAASNHVAWQRGMEEK